MWARTTLPSLHGAGRTSAWHHLYGVARRPIRAPDPDASAICWWLINALAAAAPAVAALVAVCVRPGGS